MDAQIHQKGNGMMNPERMGIFEYCKDCMGDYLDFKPNDRDCKNPKCPLYEWMPYGKKMAEHE
jgi:hypothetical protein